MNSGEHARTQCLAGLIGSCASTTSPDVPQLVLSIHQVLLQGFLLVVSIDQALIEIADVTGGFCRSTNSFSIRIKRLQLH